MSAHYKHVQNAACEYFPCHKGADPATFNCLFCYCPLYFLKDCGGNPAWRGLVKDCTGCLLPHSPGGWEAVQGRLARAYAELRAGRAPRTLGPDAVGGSESAGGPAGVGGRRDSRVSEGKTAPGEGVASAPPEKN